MIFQRRFTAAMAIAGLAVLSVTVAGCGGGGGGGGGTPPAASPPSPAITSHFSRQIEFPEFQDMLISPPGVVNRVEIEINPDSLPGPVGLEALEVEIKEPAEVADEEEIKSRIVMIEADLAAQTGRITLELGNAIDFSAATEFKDDRSSSTKLDFGPFVDAVEAALEAGPVPVKAERNPPATPQAPDDGSFVATELKLVDEDDVDGPEIEINVDADNLDGSTLTVLNLSIDISGAELQEEIKAGEVEDFPDAVVEFEDRVVAPVNVEARTFTLASGIVVHVSTDGIIDPLGDLLTLQAVADSVAAGDKVRAEGDATVAAVGPPVLLEATDVKFEVDE